MEYKHRKHPRLSTYDYSNNGAYFITICIKDRQRILSNIVRRTESISNNMNQNFYELQLTTIGRIAEKYIKLIPAYYLNVLVDKYVIMPDHIHILLSVENSEKWRAESTRPTINISRIVGALKRLIQKEVGYKIFQDSYYDHIIRGQNDYVNIWEYINTNVIRWVNKI